MEQEIFHVENEWDPLSDCCEQGSRKLLSRAVHQLCHYNLVLFLLYDFWQSRNSKASKSYGIGSMEL